MGIHGGYLKIFRFQHGNQEIPAQRHANDSENEVFHKSLSELFTADGIQQKGHEDSTG
jgi:hypothetical protein